MEVQTNPAEAASQMTPEERQSAADAEIKQGKLDDKQKQDPETPKDPEATLEPDSDPDEEQSAEAEPERVEPIGELGEWVEYNPGNNERRPALITHVDEKTGLCALMVVYKAHIDFVGEVGPDSQK